MGAAASEGDSSKKKKQHANFLPSSPLQIGSEHCPRALEVPDRPTDKLIGHSFQGLDNG